LRASPLMSKMTLSTPRTTTTFSEIMITGTLFQQVTMKKSLRTNLITWLSARGKVWDGLNHRNISKEFSQALRFKNLAMTFTCGNSSCCSSSSFMYSCYTNSSS
jgi:hypothetical protein